MKKFLSTLLFILISLSNYAQESRFETGLQLGPNSARVWGNEVVETNMDLRVGFAGGAFLQMNMNKWFSVRSHLSYELKGSTQTEHPTDINGNSLGTYHFRSSFHYMTLGFLARATIGKKVKYYLNAGPYFSGLLKETEESWGENFTRVKHTNPYNFKPFDTGISTGIGLSVPYRTKFSFSFEIRNNIGLYNISRSKSIINDGTVQHVSTNFLFGLSYRLK
ncbi:MAG: porin family protein [Bacteroidia bacterium]